MQKEVNLQNLPYVLDESHRKLGAIGLVILATGIHFSGVGRRYISDSTGFH